MNLFYSLFIILTLSHHHITLIKSMYSNDEKLLCSVIFPPLHITAESSTLITTIFYLCFWLILNCQCYHLSIIKHLLILNTAAFLLINTRVFDVWHNNSPQSNQTSGGFILINNRLIFFQYLLALH